MKIRPQTALDKAINKRKAKIKQKGVIVTAHGPIIAEGLSQLILTTTNQKKELLSFIMLRKHMLSPHKIMELMLEKGADSKNIETFLKHPKLSEKGIEVEFHSTSGWAGKYFISNDRLYGPDGNSLKILIAPPDWQSCGTLKAWKKGIKPALLRSNQLTTAIAAAFLPPLLGFLNIDNFGLHFFSQSSTGKSTILKCAGSVVADPIQYVQSGYGTSAAFEHLLRRYCGHVLIVDELFMASTNSKQLQEINMTIAYGLHEGKSKRRYTDTEFSTSNFQTVMISAGELSMAEAARNARTTRNQGEEVRVIDIPATLNNKNGVFNKLPKEFETGAALSDHIAAVVSENAGVAFELFMDKLTDSDISATTDKLKKHMDIFHKNANTGSSDKRIKRISDKFAAIYAAGALACEYGILPLEKKDIGKALRKCFMLALETIDSFQDDLAALYEVKIREALSDAAPISKLLDINAPFHHKSKKHGVVIAYPFFAVAKAIPNKQFREELQAMFWTSGELIQPPNIHHRKAHQIKVSDVLIDVWLFKLQQ